jgi:hypothetical protein
MISLAPEKHISFFGSTELRMLRILAEQKGENFKAMY